jgi:putative membrane protein
VLFLIGFHLWCLAQMRLFAAGQNSRTERYFRALNELPVFALFAIVILVVVKPF